MNVHRPATGVRVLAALLTGLVTVGTSGCTTSGTSGEASCAAPSVEVEPATVAPGDEIEITGQAFLGGCEDHPGAEESTPMTDVTVRWLQGGVTADLGTVDADEHGGWTVRATVPVDAVAGTARVDVSSSEGAVVSVSAQHGDSSADG